MPDRTFHAPIERVSANDATILATDRGRAPMNLGAVVVVERGADLEFDHVANVLGRRLTRVRRLRQRLVDTPLGCGRPIWVDAADFHLDRHLLTASPAGRNSTLDVAAELLCTRLDRGRPLWAARWVTGLPDGDAALVLVLHHCLSDGLGGLAALAALCDEGGQAGGPAETVDRALTLGFPLPAPSRRALADDARRSRAAGIHRLPQRVRTGADGLRELGARGRPHPAARTSLTRPTGARRALGTTHTPLAPLVATAHSRGCTVNDLVLCAVSGALGELLRGRGETVTELVASVPVSSRRTATAAALGNATGVMPLALPLIADANERLRRVTTMTADRSGPARGLSAGPLGLAFRVLAAVGGFQYFIDHQRLVHTFVTNVRGPASPLTFAGHQVASITPMAVTPGNVGVSFDVLSYAGQLAVTVVADPVVLVDPADLAARVGDELALLAAG